MAINNLGKKGLFQLIFPNLQSTRKGNQNRTQGNKPESGIDVEAVQEGVLLTGLLFLLAQYAFLYYIGPPAQVWHQCLWDGPSHINF